jgi:hypothetical protein
VCRLAERLHADYKTLDVLVNDIWGGEVLKGGPSDWNTPSGGMISAARSPRWPPIPTGTAGTTRGDNSPRSLSQRADGS